MTTGFDRATVSTLASGAAEPGGVKVVSLDASRSQSGGFEAKESGSVGASAR